MHQPPPAILQPPRTSGPTPARHPQRRPRARSRKRSLPTSSSRPSSNSQIRKTAARQKGRAASLTTSSVRCLELSRDRLQVAQRREPGECLALELAHPLARQVELVADRLERPRLALGAEAQLEGPALAPGEGGECAADSLLAQRLLGLVERVGRLAVCEEISELALVVGPDGLVQRDRSLGCPERFVDVLER